MKRIVPLLAGVCLLMALFATPAAAAEEVPPLPHAFYGAVEIDGSPADIGTKVEARGEGVKRPIEGNPITVTEAGKYGGSGGLDPKLVVQGDIVDGTTITFYVNNTSTGQTAKWHSGWVTELNLSVTIPTPPPVVGGVPAPTIEVTFFGAKSSIKIDSNGIVQETFTATSPDGKLTITIPKGTKALDKDGKPLTSLTASINTTPPPPPEDAYIVGLAYDFGPDGATFDPPITLTWSYDPEALPEGVAEEDLVVAFYDEATSEWVEVDSVVDTENNSITASVAHFTTFAIIGSVTPTPPAPAAFSVSSLSVLPAEVEPGETVTIAVSVANTGGKSGSRTVVLKINGVKEAEKSVTIAAGSSKIVTFSVTKEEAGSYTVTVDGRSGSFTVVSVVVPPAPAAFSVSYLSVSPRLEVEPGETVTITVLVANTGGESGSYTVVLKIGGVKEAEETVTIAAGEGQDVSFNVTREEAGSYTVAVDGLSGSFTVVAPPVGEEEEEEEKPGINWPLYGGIIGGVIVAAGLLYYFLVFRRRA